MWHDSLTVLWKEIAVLRRVYRKLSAFISTGLYVLFFGVFPAAFLGDDFVSSPLTLFYLTLVPLVTGTGMATLAFAGEREVHTLETLFASRLNDLAILVGKITAYTLYAWLYVLLCILAGWMTASMIVGRIIAYNLQILVGGLLIGFGVAFFAAMVGVLASLMSRTIKETGRKLQVLYLVFVIPYISINLMPETARNNLLNNVTRANLWMIIGGVVVLLVIVNAGLLILAVRGFNRNQMLLD